MITELIDKLVNHLICQEGFFSNSSRQEIDREAAEQGVDRVYPALLFAQWLRRCPQARAWLAQQGFPAESLAAAGSAVCDAPAQELARPDGAADDRPPECGGKVPVGCFYATIWGPEPTLVRLLESLGPIMKVVEAAPAPGRATCPRRTDIVADQVPSWSRAHMQHAVARLRPQNGSTVTFDPEEFSSGPPFQDPGAAARPAGDPADAPAV